MAMPWSDLASVVISAKSKEEISHMTVFMVVSLDSSSDGTATSPSGRFADVVECT